MQKIEEILDVSFPPGTQPSVVSFKTFNTKYFLRRRNRLKRIFDVSSVQKKWHLALICLDTTEKYSFN